MAGTAVASSLVLLGLGSCLGCKHATCQNEHVRDAKDSLSHDFASASAGARPSNSASLQGAYKMGRGRFLHTFRHCSRL